MQFTVLRTVTDTERIRIREFTGCDTATKLIGINVKSRKSHLNHICALYAFTQNSTFMSGQEQFRTLTLQ